MAVSTVDGLNGQQRRAVTHTGGPLLLLAGAGSGKTLVITRRIAHQIATGIDPSEILAVTFTNKAASEMAHRVAELVGNQAARSATIGTFHSFGLRLLDEEASRLGLRRPVILFDAGDQAEAIRQCLRGLRLDPRRHDAMSILGAISRARHDGVTPDELETLPQSAQTAALYRAYLAWLDAHGGVDFDDLLLRPVQLMEEYPDLLAAWQARFRAVLVDEYQDTNRTQFEMVRLLAGGHGNLCVVGDDDQSIYGWRGACVDNILQFEDHFPQATTIALEQNYRSTGHILSAANRLIDHNHARKAKSLWTDQGDGEPVTVVACTDGHAEATYVAAEIHRRRQGEGRPWGHFGVLFRAGTQARNLEEALRLVGIPYLLVGAYQFFDRKEVKDVLAYLRLLANPADQASFVRVVNFPPRGVGPKRLRSLLDFADGEGISPFEACARAGDCQGLGASAALALADLHRVVTDLRREATRPGTDLATLIGSLCERLDARRAWLRDPSAGAGADGRWRSIESLMGMVRSWQARQPDKSLADYLRAIVLDSRHGDDEDDGDRVTLTTIHAAKGLEWPVCFVVGCQEGLLPHRRVVAESGDVAEERRLLYVAMTRARRSLILTRSRLTTVRGTTEVARPSRFLAELPSAHTLVIDRAKGGGETAKDQASDRLKALAARYGGTSG